MLFAADTFAQNGFEASVYGFDTPLEGHGAIKIENSAAAALEGADYAVLPPVVSRDGENIFAPLSKRKIAAKELDFGGALVFCGGFCPPVLAKTRSYAACESFAVRNAVPTAEGALKIAMEARKETVCGMRASVLGFGRIGKLLAKDLLALGAEVAVFARRSEARALAEALGAKAHSFEALGAEISRFDCIFNTVPEKVLSPGTLSKIKKDAPIIELASPPGGIDAEEAAKAGLMLIAAGGLPGKLMPKSAGKIIYTTISEMMEEEEKI